MIKSSLSTQLEIDKNYSAIYLSVACCRMRLLSCQNCITALILRTDTYHSRVTDSILATNFSLF